MIRLVNDISTAIVPKKTSPTKRADISILLGVIVYSSDVPTPISNLPICLKETIV